MDWLDCGPQRITVLTTTTYHRLVWFTGTSVGTSGTARLLSSASYAIIIPVDPTRDDDPPPGAERQGTETIILYSKPGCCLCDQAREYLEDLASERELELREIDIRRDPDLFERYRYRIPVIAVDGVERLEGGSRQAMYVIC